MKTRVKKCILGILFHEKHHILPKEAFIFLPQFSCPRIKMSGSSRALLRSSSELFGASGGTSAAQGRGPQTDKCWFITHLEYFASQTALNMNCLFFSDPHPDYGA